MLDVKQSEADVPFILGGLISAFVPSAKKTIDAINARARVELKKETIVQGLSRWPSRTSIRGT